MLAEQYLQAITCRFNAIKKQGDGTLNQLSDEAIHWQPNDNSNSIAVLVKHMSGNMLSRWTDFLTTDGEKDNRNRDDEFVDSIADLRQLTQVWEHGWGVLFRTITALTPDDLTKTVMIRGEAHTVIDAIERQIAHYAQHVGQMIYIAKIVTGESWHTLSIPRKKTT